MLEPDGNPNRSRLLDHLPAASLPTVYQEPCSKCAGPRPQGCWWRRRPCLVLSSWGVQGPDAPRGAWTPQRGCAGCAFSPRLHSGPSASEHLSLTSRSPENHSGFGGTPGWPRMSCPICVVSLGRTPLLASEVVFTPGGMFTPPHTLWEMMTSHRERGGSSKMEDYYYYF